MQTPLSVSADNSQIFDSANPSIDEIITPEYKKIIQQRMQHHSISNSGDDEIDEVIQSKSLLKNGNNSKL